jgi:hypothetical protein
VIAWGKVIVDDLGFITSRNVQELLPDHLEEEDAIRPLENAGMAKVYRDALKSFLRP